MLNEKRLKHTFMLSAFVSIILIIMYYFMFYIPMTRAAGSLLGYPILLELLFVYMLVFVLTLPFSYGLFIVIDYYLDVIYPKEWMSVRLLKKHKKYFSDISSQDGSGRSGYKYWFDFQNDEGHMSSFKGSTYEYECLIEGAKVKILVKGPMILEIALIEE